jgi:hypothetical protein
MHFSKTLPLGRILTRHMRKNTFEKIFLFSNVVLPLTGALILTYL